MASDPGFGTRNLIRLRHSPATCFQDLLASVASSIFKLDDDGAPSNGSEPLLGGSPVWSPLAGALTSVEDREWGFGPPEKGVSLASWRAHVAPPPIASQLAHIGLTRMHTLAGAFRSPFSRVFTLSFVRALGQMAPRRQSTTSHSLSLSLSRSRSQPHSGLLVMIRSRSCVAGWRASPSTGDAVEQWPPKAPATALDRADVG